MRAKAGVSILGGSLYGERGFGRQRTECRSSPRIERDRGLHFFSGVPHGDLGRSSNRRIS